MCLSGSASSAAILSSGTSNLRKNSTYWETLNSWLMLNVLVSTFVSFFHLTLWSFSAKKEKKLAANKTLPNNFLNHYIALVGCNLFLFFSIEYAWGESVLLLACDNQNEIFPHILIWSTTNPDLDQLPWSASRFVLSSPDFPRLVSPEMNFQETAEYVYAYNARYDFMLMEFAFHKYWHHLILNSSWGFIACIHLFLTFSSTASKLTSSLHFYALPIFINVWCSQTIWRQILQRMAKYVERCNWRLIAPKLTRGPSWA